MLCPQCRRMVGKDGYCPMGHLARPELDIDQPRSAAPPAPPPPPVPAEAPVAVQPAPSAPAAADDPYTPPGLGPSNPPPQHSPAPSFAPPTEGGALPPPPPVPSEHPVAVGFKGSNRRTAILVALGLALIATLGFFFIGRSAGAANLKFVFTLGETHRYQVSMTMHVRGGNLTGSGAFDGTIEMQMLQKVAKVDSAGVATIEYSFEKLRMSERGRSTNIPIPSEVIRIEMAPDGRVLESSGAEFLGDINPAAGLFGPESFAPILPRHKVDPGDKWSLDGDAPNPFGEPFHIKGTASLLSRTGTGDQETAVIKTSIKSPLDFRIEFAKLGELEGQSLPAGFPKDAAMTFVGNLSMDLNQAMATKSGFLKSALGDMSMTGTFAFEGIPQVGNVSGVLNMTMQLTMTALS